MSLRNVGPIVKRKGRIKKGINFVNPGKFWRIKKNK